MTAFAVGKPVTTDVPRVSVDAGLPVGTHRFRLEVVSSSGKTSLPNEVLVQITNGTTPVRLSAPAGNDAADNTPTARKTRSKT